MLCQEIPGFYSRFTSVNDIKLHWIHNGDESAQNNLCDDPRPAILFLHGFPEYHGAWRKVLPLLSQDYLIIAPDQRGFNLSSAPIEPEAYQTKILVSDITELMKTNLPGRPFHLVGHDWGASIAYALAMRNAEHIISLTVINGVHPIPFQHALINDAAQIKASQYINVLSAPGASEKMSADGFAKTFAMFEKFSSTPWLNDEIRRFYLAAWSRDDRMNAMLNWYRATPVIIPTQEAPNLYAPLLDVASENFLIPMPHQVIWGMEDTALLPIARKGLEAFAPNYKLTEVADAGHWINHTHSQLVARKIREFVHAC